MYSRKSKNRTTSPCLHRFIAILLACNKVWMKGKKWSILSTDLQDILECRLLKFDLLMSMHGGAVVFVCFSLLRPSPVTS